MAKSAKPTRKSTTTSTSDASDLPFIGRPAKNALEVVSVTKLSQVAKMSEKELLALHGVGPKAVRILREALKERGLAFRA